jgi:hypothetical protein
MSHGALVRLLKAVQEQLAVGQVREEVVVRLVMQALPESLALGDVSVSLYDKFWL